MWDHAAAQELLDALFAKAAELDERGRHRAQEDERRACDTPVDFTGLNSRTCRWPLFEGTSRSMKSSTAEHGRAPEAIIAPRTQVRPSSKSSKPRHRHTDSDKAEADDGFHYVSSAECRFKADEEKGNPSGCGPSPPTKGGARGGRTPSIIVRTRSLGENRPAPTTLGATPP
jgi:hypothetical protein